MKTSMLIIDGNNWFRRRAETDLRGNPLRSCYNEIQNAPYDVVLLVWDGFNSRKHRKAIYPEYKERRVAPKEDFFEYQKTFKQVAKYSRAIIFEVPEYEADDVIAKLALTYKKDYNITVESSDADFLQLGVHVPRAKLTGVETEWVTLYKTLVGDKSDNVKGIHNYGDKGWESLTAEVKKGLQSFVKGDSGLPAEYEQHFKPSQWKWLQEFNNQEQLRIYWKVVNFLPMTDDQLNRHMVHGNVDQKSANEIFDKYFA